jgi:hypothetical protein
MFVSLQSSSRFPERGSAAGREQIPEPGIGLQPVGSEMLAAADYVAEA